jgi:hypothetical protein
MMTDLKHYIVGLNAASDGDRAELFGRLIEAAKDRPDVSVGALPQDRVPSILKVKASEQAARELMQQFGGELIIEPDAPLQL